MAPVTDKQVRKLREEMAKHGVLEIAAMKADMHRNTARKYLNTSKFPSDLKLPREWRTRTDPFAEDWAAITERLTDAPELEAKHMFWDLMRLRPGIYQEGQLRTFQRRVQVWQAHHGIDKEVFFPQEHIPGEAMQTDFTWATELEVTIQGEEFPHMLCHMVLPWSNWNYATVSQSESMLALRNGIASALVQLGRVPQWHQTDNSTAATHRITGKEDAELETPEKELTGDCYGQKTREFNTESSPLRRNRPLLLLRNRPGSNPERALNAPSQPPWGGAWPVLCGDFVATDQTGPPGCGQRQSAHRTRPGG